MRQAVRNKNTWVALLTWAFYWVFAPFLDNVDLYNLLSGLAVSVGFGVLVAWFPGLFQVLRERDRAWSSGYYLVGAVCTITAGFIGLRTWVVQDRIVNHTAQRLTESLVPGWFIWIMISGFLVALTSVGAVEGRIPTRNWIRAGILVAIGLAAATLLAVMDPSDTILPSVTPS